MKAQALRQVTFRMLAIPLVAVSFSLNAFADEEGLDPATKEALFKTQALLKSRSEREKASENDPKARAALRQADDTVGVQNSDEFYLITGLIFTNMVKTTKGDTKVMKDMIEQAKTNPEEFYNSLSAEQKEMIRELASKVAPGKVKKGDNHQY